MRSRALSATLSSGRGRLVASILGRSAGKARRDRARWIVDLAELQHLAIGRTFVTLDRVTGEGEWTRIWMRSRRWNGAVDTPRRHAFWLKRELWLVGLELEIETPEDEHTLRIHVGTAEIRAAVQLELDEAFEILARDGSYVPDLTPRNVVNEYAHKKIRLRQLSRRLRTHYSKIRALLLAEKQPLAPRGRPRLEVARPCTIVEAARRAARAGVPLVELMTILGCKRAAAVRFKARAI